MSAASRIAKGSIVALAALQLVWHGYVSPPTTVVPWALAVFFLLPILPSLVLVLIGHRRAAFWGALAALLYFSHGVMVAWSSPGEQGLGFAQAALSALLVVTASWDGMKARLGKRPPPPAL